MSFGKSKGKSESKSSSSETRQNFDLMTPYGDTTTQGNVVTYSPELFSGQAEGFDIASQKATDILSALNPNFNVEQAYNNPFYGNTRDLLQSPILRSQKESAKELQNQLAARNQLGGSLEAYSKSLQDQQFGDRLDSADRQARNFSFDAYQNNLNNQLATLEALRGDIGQSFGQAITPLSLALGMPAYNIAGSQRQVGKSSNTNFGFNGEKLIGALLGI